MVTHVVTNEKTRYGNNKTTSSLTNTSH
jgi:hypothetical protein